MSDFNARIIREFRENGGKVGPPFEGAPMILLHTTGARSGAERVQPLVYFDIDGRRYVVASKAGADTHPAWFHNLVANPEVTAEVGTDRYAASARVLEPEERGPVWEEVKRRNPGFADYERKTDRVIPVVELVPA